VGKIQPAGGTWFRKGPGAASGQVCSYATMPSSCGGSGFADGVTIPASRAPAQLGVLVFEDVGSQREFGQATQAPHQSGRTAIHAPDPAPQTRRSELQLAEHEQDDQHDNNHPDDTDPAIAAHAASCELPGTGIPGLRP
jgi:hypothetical protein